MKFQVRVGNTTRTVNPLTEKGVIMIRVALRADVKLVEDVRRALEKLLINDDYFKCVEHGNGSCGYQHWVCLCDKAEITIVDDVIILFGERQVINFGLGLPDELRDAMVMFYETDDDDLLPSASYCWYETVESSLPKALRLVCDWTCIKAVNIPDVIILGKLVRALACFENVSLC